jgi:hypothetical protein
VVRISAWAAIRYQLGFTNSWCDVHCCARQMHVGGCCGLSGMMAEPQAYRMTGALAGLEGPKRRAKHCELQLDKGEEERGKHGVEPNESWSERT